MLSISPAVKIFLYAEPADLRRGYEQLERNDSLDATAQELTATVDQQSSRIEKLEHELQLFRRHLFGQRRERFVDDPRQQQLFELAEAEPEKHEVDASTDDAEPPKRRRRPPPATGLLALQDHRSRVGS